MWNPYCAISEADAVLASKNDTITYMRIIKDGKRYYILLRLNWRTEELYLATTRNRKEPRDFHNLDRLFEYIENNFPSVDTVNVVLRIASDTTKETERRSALPRALL